jgi:hypothetical protein
MSWKHISGWVDITGPEGPIDPGYGRPGWGGPADPGWGVRPPIDPGYGRPDWGAPFPPDEGHIWGALIRWLMRPHVDNDPSKPPGRPVLPPHVDNGLPPNGGRPPHPWRPGHWEPIDPGYGKPPLWGFIPGIDNGLPQPPASSGQTIVFRYPGRPEIGGDFRHLPPASGGGPIVEPAVARQTNASRSGWSVGSDRSGFWETDPAVSPIGGKPHPPIWAWIPDRPDMPGGGGGSATVTIYPATVTVLASGGTGSVNPTISPAGATWEVDAASVPAWVTITPMGPQTTDVNIVYKVSPNTTGVAKQALIKVCGATLTINQGAV